VLPFLLVALAVAAAAVSANLLLLGAADSRDPVGRLSPVQPALTGLATTTTAPSTTRPAATTTTSDDRGGGRDHPEDD